MDIYGESGNKVRYTGEGGYESDRTYANQYIDVGSILTIKHIEIGGWTTYVTFEEIPGRSFNSVMFEDVNGTE